MNLFSFSAVKFFKMDEFEDFENFGLLNYIFSDQNRLITEDIQLISNRMNQVVQLMPLALIALLFVLLPLFISKQLLTTTRATTTSNVYCLIALREEISLW